MSEDLQAIIAQLHARIRELEHDVANHRDRDVRLLETLQICGYDHEEQLAQGPIACVEHLVLLVRQLERRYAIIWERNVNLILLRVPNGMVVQALGDADVDTVGRAWTLRAVEDAHKHASKHRAEIEASKECACFYCLKRFPPSEIREWVPEHAWSRVDGGRRVQGELLGHSALCPRCGIDSVLGDASGVEMTDEFMRAMQRHWFKQGTDAHGNEWRDPE